MLDTILRIPPFNVRVQSSHAAVEQHLARFYGDFTPPSSNTFIDFRIRILHGAGLRRFWRPQARFLVDDQNPFIPLPANQAAPMLEWGLNWTIASRALGYLVLHAAVLARGDDAIILPGFPGAGKSTLCASLCHLADWRLFSDELAILDPDSGQLIPNPRPINLKNRSIDIVGAFPGARLGPRYHDTRKGIVAHAAAPASSIAQAECPGRPRWLVFPRYQAGASTTIEPMTRAEAFTLIQEQSFNRERMGDVGFRSLCDMLSQVDCYRIDYGSTDAGLAAIHQVVDGPLT